MVINTHCIIYMDSFNFKNNEIKPGKMQSWIVNRIHYMAESASRQNEAKLLLWLATQAGLHVSCTPNSSSRLGLASKSSLFAHVIDPLLTKLVCSTWLDIGFILQGSTLTFLVTSPVASDFTSQNHALLNFWTCM